MTSGRTMALVAAVCLVATSCGGDDRADTVDTNADAEPTETSIGASDSTTNDTGELRTASEARAEEAVEGLAVAIGEPGDLGGVVVRVDDIAASGRGDRRHLNVTARVENSTDEDIAFLDASIFCAGNEDGGGWLGESTLNLNVGIPAGTFDEGVVGLLAPGDGRIGDEQPFCAAPAHIVISPFGPRGLDADAKVVVRVPDDVLDELNATASSAPQEDDSTESSATVSTEAEEDAAQEDGNQEPAAEASNDSERAADIILTLGDLDGTWSANGLEEGDDDSDDSESCFEAGFGSDGELSSDDEAEASFSQSDFGPFLSASVVVGAEGAEEEFDRLAQRFESCDGYTDPDGIVWSVSAVDFPALGDDTFAVRLSAASEMFPVEMVFATTRSDDTVITAAHVVVGGGTSDVQLLATVLATMLDRL